MFGCLPKFKNSHVISSGFLARKRVPRSEMAGPKITKKRSLSIPDQKRSTQKTFVCKPLLLCQRNRMWTQKTLFLGWDELESVG